MKGYIGNTDFQWYDFLRQQGGLEEVNFWQPSGQRGFHAIPSGAPFFFRLKVPHNAIAGYGYLSRHEVAPSSVAWESFGVANGAPDFATMRRRIQKYRRAKEGHEDYEIGCLMVLRPVFFPESAWVREPADWSPNIVQGKTIDLASPEGTRIWSECRMRAGEPATMGEAIPSERFGSPQVILPRLGQASFRIAVLQAYERACAVTTEHSLPTLDAAHIRPYADGGEHLVSNGLLLRSDIHRLFDKGYVTVTPDLRFEVSRRLKDDFNNGKSYYSLQGSAIHIPSGTADRPDLAMLSWHNSNRFLG